ncbi:MAG TPA: hypothetical protein VF292_07165 [Rhodanobacteraceae bacterium]
MQAGAMRAQFVFPTLPRNPLLRGLLLAFGVIVVVGLLTVGFVVGIAALAVAIVALTVRRWRLKRAARAADAEIIEGEFTVVDPQQRARLPEPR